MNKRSTGLLTGKGRSRQTLLRGRITRQTAGCCIARLLLLAVEGPGQPIVKYIDSPGGSLAESLAIISTMNGVRCPIVTHCRAHAGGAAAVIAAHGLKGFRSASPHAWFSLKLLDPTAGAEPAPSLVQRLAEILADDTAQPPAKVLGWLKHGAEFNAQQALAHGLVDAIGTDVVRSAPARV